MTRNTHHYVNDHHDIEDLVTALEAEGIGGGGGGSFDLLTGNDQNFNASLGNWVNSGGTLTRDTTWIITGYSAGSLKHATTDTGQYVEVPVSGTFTANQAYWGVVAIGIEETSGAFAADLSLGLHGTDSAAQDIDMTLDVDYYPSSGIGKAILYAVRWVPSADRTGVTLRLTRENSSANGTKTPHIYTARVFQSASVPMIRGLGSAGEQNILVPGMGDNERMTLGMFNGAQGITQLYTGEILMITANADAFIDLYDVSGGTPIGNIDLWANGPAGDMTFDNGVSMYLGEDFLGLVFAEKSSDTLQLFTDGDYDVELADAATNGWMIRNAADQTARLANLMISSINFTISNNGSAISTGTKGFLEIPFPCTITANRLVADQTGSIVIDLKKATYSGLFTTSSITASAKPTLSSARKSEDTTLSGWTTSVSAGDWLEVIVDSASTVTQVTLALTLRRS